ncbi:DUF2975 domain-containing protein [Companilactobacillus baiquanensis]|uniref:DUF2975 domain-containing protein n=1 Tax=Companilactobacillus baiquanensis TaxID=2486005 RepID=A0ABW1UY12_9LACO|nr:DUF2975 domain-containing protein [Companilactobacillus baiquanensis]
MKRETIFLRIAIYIMALIMLAICIIVIPHHLIGANKLMHNLFYNWILGSGMYLTALLFFTVLWQALKLLHLIDQNKAFSKFSVNNLKKIKIAAYLACLIYILESPFFYMFADKDDAPGVVVIGIILAGTALVIALFASMLQKLLNQAIKIKSENDLTI